MDGNMESPRTLTDVLVEAKAQGIKSIRLVKPLPQTWSELRLGGALLFLRICFAAYSVSLILFWCNLFRVVNLAPELWMTCIGILTLGYFLLIGAVYRIQCVLYEAKLQTHRAWRVWFAALILNPIILGWYIPVAAMFRLSRIKKNLKTT
ncbi:hypothetical protein [Undibacterium flavidum]|uniref:Uncharacterized protein n=1 Tax=Undibacterium flavidum TaxID=2762297 RepID=A0ABR6YHQ8_9BURK|nr:hypothetical protein [Undibacterium flavidum]MBC3876037.1 hypothetical protein [Undibacterium flavidum]